MTLTREEAAKALSEMESAQTRTSVLAGYAAAWPILMIWGAEWFICNLASQYGGEVGRWAWPVGTVAALALTYLVSRRTGSRSRGWRSFETGATVALFFSGLFTIARIQDFAQVDAVISLTVAGAYIVLGLWTGARYAWLGLALGAAVMAGWLLFPAYFFVWMAFVGGGALALGGLWLRRA